MEYVDSGMALAPAKARNLPVRILKAFDNAKHILGLTRSVKDTLAELCRFVPQNDPFATVFAHKDKIAERIGASERTVYRHLDTLKDQDLIEILPQERKSRNGRFGVARIRLTHKAAELLGFIESKIDVIHTPPSDKMTDGHTLTEPTISKSHRPCPTKNGLPVDLAWMTGNGLSRAGIFNLMGKAKSHGKRLSDIATAVRAYIKDLKGGRLYAYLEKLAMGPTDFTCAAAAERKRVAEAHAQACLKQKSRLFRERFRKAVLTDRAQKRLYLIDESARFVQVIADGIARTASLYDLAPWIDALEKGNLVLATLETERRLMQEI